MQAHVRFEDVGSFETPFAESWLRHRVCGCGKQDVGQLDPLGADLLVVLGGPIGVNDHAAYPVVTQEIEHFSGSRFIPSLSQHGSNTGCWDMQANWRQLASVP